MTNTKDYMGGDVTAPVTGRRAVLLNAITQARHLRKLTLDKVQVMNDLIESLHNEYRKETKHDEERLHRLEQAVHRLTQDRERAGSGADRRIAPDQPPGER